MKKVCDFFDGRTIRFREAHELIILNEEHIRKDRMPYIDRYMRCFVDTIYVRGKNGEILGIMTPGDVRKSISLDTCVINKKYKYISNEEHINEEYIKAFFDTYTTIRNLPVVVNNQIIGEYELQTGDEEFHEKMQWNAFSRGIQEFLREKNIKKIFVPPSEELLELKRVLEEMGDVEVVSKYDESVDISVQDTRGFKENLMDAIQTGITYNEHEVMDIYTFYIKCMIRYIFRRLNERHVKMCLVETPKAEKIIGFSNEEKETLQNIKNIDQIIHSESQILDEFFMGGKSKAYVTGKEFKKVQYVNNGHYYHLADFQGDYLNIIGGKRVTVNSPKKYNKTIYVFGNCTARGQCVCDSETIESYLQGLCNENCENSVRVVNCGVVSALGCINDLHYTLNTQMQDSDIVVWLADYEDEVVEVFKDCGIEYLETSFLFNEPNEYGRWFLDTTSHVNHVANQLIASFIYENLKDAIEEVVPVNREKFVLSQEKVESLVLEESLLENYIQMVFAECKKKRVSIDGNVGAIVMNCNPFTNGHKYLIERSVRNVDTLIVFVVEEDKSVFPFKDRIELVKKGTAEWENIVVVPSGKFIISSVTFPGYFIKDQLQEVEIDSSRDVNIFAKYIAPKLNIKTRFVGEEPFDMVTRLYNMAMERILPEYGIEFVEIARKKWEEQVISASHVRKLLEEKKYEEVKRLVPITTFEYLEKYGY